MTCRYAATCNRSIHRCLGARVRATMSLDKKTRGARLRMVILDGVGNLVIYDSPPEDLLAEAYRAVAA